MLLQMQNVEFSDHNYGLPEMFSALYNKHFLALLNASGPWLLLVGGGGGAGL